MEDSFDDLIANCDVPSPPKQQKSNDTKSDTIIVKDEPSTTKTKSKAHCVLVSSKQRGNPLLKCITNIPWEYDNIVPDYIMGKTTCALYLSLRYHNMKPDYIHERLKLLGKSFELRVLLVLVDIKEPHILLKNLTRICILANLTLMLAWNHEEAGRIIETYKMFENKPPDIIMEKSEQFAYQKLASALTNIKPVNQTDAMTLLSSFGSLEKIVKSTESRLGDCTGFGSRKAARLYKTLHEPFLKRPSKTSGTQNVKKSNETISKALLSEDDIDKDVCDVLDEQGY